MIPLNDPRWKEFEGGYRLPYDASNPLRRLEQATTPKEIQSLYSELWNELHHQGDVGLASYFAVPHLVRIAIAKKLLDYNVFGLISTIEIERHNSNPELPTEFEGDYLHALRKDLPKLIQMTLDQEWDLTLASTVLSAMAISKGQIELANAISKMDDVDIMKEFLENF